MKKTFLTIAIIFACNSLFAQTFFKSANYPYIIETQLGYNITTKPGVDYLATSPSGSSVSVVVKKMTKQVTLEDMDKLSENQLRSMYSPPLTNVKIIKKGMKYNPSSRLSYFMAEMTSGVLDEIHSISLMYFKEGNLYVVTSGQLLKFKNASYSSAVKAIYTFEIQ